MPKLLQTHAVRILILSLTLATGRTTFAAEKPPEQEVRGPMPMLESNIDRPLRYFPQGTDFVITNGPESFNRPLYANNTAFRIDGGDRPEFSLYLPGRGGNLRFGIRTGKNAEWLDERDQIVARYRPGSLIYETHGKTAEDALKLTVLPLANERGVIGCVEVGGLGARDAEFILAFGGANGMRGRRNGDIGCESQPVSDFFKLRPDQCKGNVFDLGTNTFVLRGKSATLGGVLSSSRNAIADAKHWSSVAELLKSLDRSETDTPLVVCRRAIASNERFFFLLKQTDTNATVGQLADLASDAALEKLFNQAEEHRRSIAERVVVETPDPFINAAAAALNVAANAVWDEAQDSFMHGAVAWRNRLLGWRGMYSGDALGWHNRTRQHFEGFAKQQNTNPVPNALPTADASANLSRNEAALHSNGDMTKTHYDMNLVAVDAFFRHLLWTGDLDFARREWPVIERHLAWERRLFRREFGPDKLPLYEAYAAIWASDDLAYNGGGSAHGSAYNFYHNRMAARVAKLIGKDPTPYEREAELIAKGMREFLWIKDTGSFAEWKDLLGEQRVHANAAVWTFYHTIDSEVPTPSEAWQMSRFVDTEIARIPVRGPNVPPGNFTIPTTSWMPYTWSLNNVVMAESMHTALAYWQANRADTAFPLFKGALLDSMYLGLCPGNVGATTFYDANRRETQRDFADGVGATSRALIEGLFGIKPDALSGELVLEPGFPAQWDHAAIKHPDVNVSFQRTNDRLTYSIEMKSPKAMRVRLRVSAVSDSVAVVTINNQEAKWRSIEDSVGTPMMEIVSDPSFKTEISVLWKGKKISPAPEISFNTNSSRMTYRFTEDQLVSVNDPQSLFRSIIIESNSFHATFPRAAKGSTVFAKVRQGEMIWWRSINVDVHSGIDSLFESLLTDWDERASGARFEPINLTSHFNDRVTQIFRNEYLAPRSPFCSLATPKQGIGSWCHPNDTFDVDDSGLRAAARRNGGKILLPNGVPLATPSDSDSKNILFTSQWTNYPSTATVPLSGTASHAFLLMAGSTDAMQSRFENGEVIFTYTDGSTARLPLINPINWWPIDQDYFIDDFAFRRPEPIPPRVDLETGQIRVLDVNEFKGKGRTVPGGAATVLDLPLDSGKELKSLSIHSMANEVVIGLMAVTLQR
jgi:hypothetical protein